MAQTATSLQQFAAALLPQLTTALEVQIAQYWVISNTGVPHRIAAHCKTPTDQPSLGNTDALEPVAAAYDNWHTSLPVRDDQRVMRVSQTDPDAAIRFLAAITDGTRIWGVLDISLSPPADLSLANIRGVLAAFSELAADFHQGHELTELRQIVASSDKLNSFLQSLYAANTLAATAVTLANDGCWWFGVDRLTVLELHADKCRILAVSGIDLIDRRSATCHQLEDLASYVANSGESLAYPTEKADCADELLRMIDEYVDESHTQSFLAVPLSTRTDGDETFHPETIGVVILEQFSRTLDWNEIEQKMAKISPHFAVALYQAMQREYAPLAKLSTRLQQWRTASPRRRFMLSVASVLLAICVLGSLFIKMELRIAARGQLQPRERRSVFITEDGIVERIHVRHGDVVDHDQLLAELSQPDLEYAISQIDGQLRTSQQERAAIVANRWTAERDTVTGADESQLAAEEQRLTESIAGLERQRQILQQRLDNLQIRSPISGEVVGWNMDDALLKRPVQRGQRLMTVIRRDGPWIAELKVADRDIAHVLRAKRKSARPLAVRLLLATDPGRTYTARLRDVSCVTDDEQFPVVTVTAQLLGMRPTGLQRPGSEVIGRIDCGEHAAIYVVTRRLQQWLRSQWWW